MKIQNSKVNLYNNYNLARTQTKQISQSFGNSYVTKELPSTYSVGVSQINTNIPVSYTKLGEIPIPNLENNAHVFQLANGQKIIILQKKGPTQIKTTFNVGSLNETEDIRGISHYIEHNLFNGSKGLKPKEYDKRVSQMGGYTNASTSFATTDYYMTMQLLDDNFLEEGIKLNAEQTQFPTFPKDQLQKEKEPVKSEIDLYKDDISDVSSSRMLKNLFGIQTNASNFILGSKQNINSFTQEKVFDYYNTWYTPDNAVTVITGDVDVNETIGLVAKHFNKRPDYSKVAQRHTEPIHYLTQSVRNDFVQKGSPISNISMGFAIPENTSMKDIASIDLLLDYLYSENSNLSKALDKYGIILDFTRERMQNTPNGAQALYTSINLPEEQVEDILKIIYRELTNVANNPIQLDVFNDAKQSFIESFEYIGEYSQGANAVLTNVALTNDFNYIQKKQAIIQSLTPADITNAARKFMDLNKVSVCVGHSDGTKPESIMQNYQKTYNVSFGKANPLQDITNRLSQVKQYRLANNVETTIIPALKTGDSIFNISLKTDTMKDVPAPAIDILNVLLNRGNAIKGNDGVNKILSKNNIGIVFETFSNGLDISAAFKDVKMQEALSLIKETLAFPNFSQAEFDRAKENLRDVLANSSTSTIDLYSKEIFGDIKVFNTPAEQLQELDKLTLDDIKALYQRILSSSQCEATCTIPVNEKPYLQDMFHNALSIGMPIFQPIIKNRSINTSIYKPITQAKTLTAVEEKAQADITQTYTYRNTNNVEDNVKLEILNIILGAGMSSRLFTDLREKEKLAYRVSSSLSSQNDTGIINLKIATTTDPETVGEGSPENATKAIAGFERNVAKLKTELVTQEELDFAKNSLKTDLLDILETNGSFNDFLKINDNSPYGINKTIKLYETIDKITPEDILATANYIFKNPPITSIVASSKTLEALNLKQ